MNNELTLRIILKQPLAGVDYGIQKGSGTKFETIQKQKSESKDLQFEFTIEWKTDKDGSPNFLGAFVQGPRDNRFIYIDIGTIAGQKDSLWTRRLKIPLAGITMEVINQYLSGTDSVLESQVAGIGKDGGPSCGAIKPFNGWHLRSLNKAE